MAKKNNSRQKTSRGFAGGAGQPSLRILETLLSQLPVDTLTILENFDSVVQGVRPLSSKQLLQLPQQIRQLSHLLTDQRGVRRVGYLNDTLHLSAYIRYFQWWNLVRLTKLFAGLPQSQLQVPENGVCLDIGSGPLTVPIALWLARPDLREKNLTWYCMDYSQTALSLGEELYLAVVARTIASQGSARSAASQSEAGMNAEEDSEAKDISPWKIVRIKGELAVAIRQKAHLVTAANVFNEIVDSSGKPPEFTAQRAAAIISHYADSRAQVLVVEPGTPPAVRFLTAFRGALARKGLRIVSPCPAGMEWTGGREKGGTEKPTCACPMDGSRGNKWCHFTFPTEAAPARLQKLSASVGLPKERASLAFVLASSVKTESPVESKSLVIRIISEPINLPGDRIGQYGCCRLGLVLVSAPSGRNSASRKLVGRQAASSQSTEVLAFENLSPGKLVQVSEPKNPRLDRKSSALVVNVG